MSLRDFRKAGHTPTLFCAFLYFDISFMVWMLLGALAPFLVEQFRLTPAQKGLMVAVPLLGGAVLRLRSCHPSSLTTVISLTTACRSRAG